ncbi:hypothetical protein AK88_02086 [Plasmodium fragile]|uniref:Tryptophan/threonine-rich plasmodium antigen C-terminal domain-containing protein n=1 Tax=Plasmodium fragile TaxID=5857 RepID=A0A0D9QMJ8_PLAFR|nr:uncharacterized protein AK88_02086 [Plasmodium fragile]KJP88305.1 hypothetical protein AK88_02086 [Plasmodium fragile]
MESSKDSGSITNQKSSFTKLKVHQSDILFCVNVSFLKFCAHFVVLAFALYIVIKHFFPSVFKKLNNKLNSNTLNYIKHERGYVDESEEKAKTDLGNEDVFEDAHEEVYTSLTEISTGEGAIGVLEATNCDKEKEDEKGKGDNQIQESETNVANIYTKYNTKKNEEVKNEVKEADYISMVEGKDLKKKEESDDNNAKEGEKYNLIPENNDTVVNTWETYSWKKKGTSTYGIKENDEKLSDNAKNDQDLTEAKENNDNEAAYSMNVKNITNNVEKGVDESTSKRKGQGKKYVYKKKPKNFQIKKEEQDNERPGTSYSSQRGEGGCRNRRKMSSVSLLNVRKINESETDNYELKVGEGNIHYYSENDLSKLGENDEDNTVSINDKMKLDTRKVKKKIVKGKKKDAANEDAKGKDLNKRNLKKNRKKDPKEEEDTSKDLKRAVSLDVIYNNDLEAMDDEIEDDKSHEWKMNEWSKWLIKTKEDCEFFNTSIENKRKRWLEKKEKEFDVWLMNLNNGWMHYRVNEENEYKSKAMKNASTWDDSQWEQWIQTEGKKSMEADLTKWLNDNETFWYDWISKEWAQWKNIKMLQWLSVDWKHKEDETFGHYKSSKFINMLHKKKRSKWMKWKERSDKEKEEWNNWIKSKENYYLNYKWDEWLKWKKDKRVFCGPQFLALINKWISNKQWTVWIEDQKDATL